jgi:ATP-binding cassette subfamily B (MDR/TAP) protein 1
MKDKAAFYSYLYILLAGVAFFSAIAQYYGIVGIGERISASLRSQLYEALLRQPVGYFDFPDHTPGQLATMLAEDVRTIHKAFGESLAKQLMAVCALIVGVVISLVASWKLSLVVLATFPLNIVASIVYMQAWTGQQ